MEALQSDDNRNEGMLQLDAKDAELLRLDAELRRLQDEMARRDRAYELLAAETEAIRKAALSDKLVAGDYIRSLREQCADLPRLREAEQQLIAQTEELILEVQGEASEMAMLIDIVQGSYFWKLKRWLNRVSARVMRR